MREVFDASDGHCYVFDITKRSLETLAISQVKQIGEVKCNSILNLALSGCRWRST